jgi:hypothetical protein
VYSVRLDGVSAGDSLAFFANGQFTNDTQANVMVSWKVVLSESAYDANSGALISRPAGYNLSPLMHHGFFTNSGVHTFDKDYSSVYVHVIARSASSAARVPGYTYRVTVNRGYGDLSGLLICGAKDGE